MRDKTKWCWIRDISKEVTAFTCTKKKTGVSESPAKIATKLMHLHPRKSTYAHNIYATVREASLNFVKYCLQMVHAGDVGI
jgi:hypothetical protein